jgi:hypothetical protein
MRMILNTYSHAAYRVMVITGFKSGRGGNSLSRGSLRG